MSEDKPRSIAGRIAIVVAALAGAAIVVIAISLLVGGGSSKHTMPVRGRSSPSTEAPAAQGTLNAPIAAGTSASNIALNQIPRRVMLRWVARRTGTLSALDMRIEAGGADCRTDATPGYGDGNGGMWSVSTHPVRADGTPDMSSTLAHQQLTPCKGPSSVVDVRAGTVHLAMNLPVKQGQEFATVVGNPDPEPGNNFTSTNFLHSGAKPTGAQGRNERDPNAKDVYYGLDPRELVGLSSDGGKHWTMPGTPGDPGYLPTYIQEYSDGTREGQPYYYSTPPKPGETMVYPHVPVRWTIRALGAYTAEGGGSSPALVLKVNGSERARVAAPGSGMLRVAIKPVTVGPGQTVSVTAEGIPVYGIVADQAWGAIMGFNRPSRPWYLQGSSDFSQAAPIYPLPMYPLPSG